ncbi:MAG: hypothetical protein A2048_02290 [Deltaproteobacteria bacterium GWA2_45_12]|nr:MAG: hypothetical protein A2048_02290 [Deltaproteobacteria bacterium GWA2_45_12]
MSQSGCDFLFVDPDGDVLFSLTQKASQQGWSFKTCTRAQAALDILEKEQIKVVVAELNLPDFSSLQILEWLQTQAMKPEVILMTAQASVETAIKAMKMHAFDYLMKPFSENEAVVFCMRQALDKYHLVNKMTSGNTQGTEFLFSGIVGQSQKLKAVLDMVTNVVQSDTTVLILGESGTGKELVAKALHQLSHRKDKPFVAIHCAAMPETLLESELFGYVRGSFTDAGDDKEGLFEVANGGIVFLDEIGEMTLTTQVKLLRVLQEGEVRRVGDTVSKKVDVRIVAATNSDLTDMVAKGLFREDLFYRLNVIAVTLPPLRERGEDIILLANHFLHKIASKLNKPVHKLSVDALEALKVYPWPGNIRELENTIERAVVLSEEDTIRAKNLTPSILSRSFYTPPVPNENLSFLAYKEAKKRAVDQFNSGYITDLVDRCQGNMTQAALKAGMDRSNFKKIFKKYIKTKS